MTLADQQSPGEAFSLFDRAGLSRETVKAWLGSDDAVSSDYRQAAEKFSRRWRIGAGVVGTPSLLGRMFTVYRSSQFLFISSQSMCSVNAAASSSRWCSPERSR